MLIRGERRRFENAIIFVSLNPPPIARIRKHPSKGRKRAGTRPDISRWSSRRRCDDCGCAKTNFNMDDNAVTGHRNRRERENIEAQRYSYSSPPAIWPGRDH